MLILLHENLTVHCPPGRPEVVVAAETASSSNLSFGAIHSGSNPAFAEIWGNGSSHALDLSTLQNNDVIEYEFSYLP